MPKRYPKQARDLAIALYLEDLSVPEITRRFNEGTAGLTGKGDKPIPIDIGERRVAEYIAEYKAKHGPRPEPEDQELTVDSINRVKQRALNVLAREIAHLEQLPKGRISAKQSTALRQHYATLDDMERRAEIAEKRKAKGKGAGKKPGAPSGKSESAIDALAKQGTGGKHAGARENGMAEPDAPENTPELAAGQQACRREGHDQAPEREEGPVQSRETQVDNRSIYVPRGLSPEELEAIGLGSGRS